VQELADRLGLEGSGVGMLTAVDVRTVSSASDHGVRVDATVGLTHPVWAAAHEEVASSAHAVGTVDEGGTVNILALIPERLSDAAMVNVVSTATEAKSQALWEAGLAATGTPSDAVCVFCPAGGSAHAFGGPRSKWGARLARAVHRAVQARCRSLEPFRNPS
jgi:adenosylcobinamide amidohydrolase